MRLPIIEGLTMEMFRNRINESADQTALGHAVKMLQIFCHGLSHESGWWKDKKGHLIDAKDHTVALSKVALMHSELSEAVEGIRKDSMDDHLPHRKASEVEFADAIIRILDYAGAANLDVAGALVDKLIYNVTRPDHKPENRNKIGGKKI